MEAVPGEVRAPRRTRELLPAQHLHASGALAREITEGRLPEERGLLGHGLGVVGVVVTLVLGDADDEALDALGVRDDATVGETVVGAEALGRDGRAGSPDLRGAARRRVPPLDGPEGDGVDAARQVIRRVAPG
jgi:hypothetical protein